MVLRLSCIVSRDAVTIAAKTHLMIYKKVSGATTFWARVVLTVNGDPEPGPQTAAKLGPDLGDEGPKEGTPFCKSPARGSPEDSASAQKQVGGSR